MQIRLTVLGPRESGSPSQTAHTSLPHVATAHRSGGDASVPVADVLVSAPVGTTLGAVAGALAGAVGARPGGRAGRAATHIHLYAQGRRLDEHTVLGHPPLVDGAVLRLDAPDPDDAAEPGGATTALHVVGGPDAGGIHLLHPGRVVVGRSSDADVPLDDPDVSRFHLALEVGADGRVTIADTGSTNGTELDGRPVGAEPRPVPPGALIALGESALRVVPASPDRADVVPDGHGTVQVPTRAGAFAPGGSPGFSGGPGGLSAAGGPGRPSGRTASGTGMLPSAPEAAPGAPRAPRARNHAPQHPSGASAVSASDAPAGGASDPGSGGRPQLTHGRGFRIGLGLRRPAQPAAVVPAQAPPRDSGRWPDPAEVLLTAIGPGPRLWERTLDHPDALVLRLGTRAHTPVTLDLRAAGSLGLTGPRPRLTGLVRALLAQLAVLHAPSALELVLISADESRPLDDRTDAWSWLPWLPHLRPTHGQPCRALTAFDAQQALARLGELAPGWGEDAAPVAASGAASVHAHPGPRGRATVIVIDGDPGSEEAREAIAELLAHGPARGIHVLHLDEYPEALPQGCGAVVQISGEVGTLLDMERPAPSAGSAARGAAGQHRAAPERELVAGVALDAVGAAWAGRLARALAPLREQDAARRPGSTRAALPEAARLLDLLDLDLVTPAKISARWADLRLSSGDVPTATVGVARDGGCSFDLTDHLLIGGAPQSGRTELLRSLLASLAVAERPDRLGLLLIEGRPPQDPAHGLAPAVELPHVIGHVATTDGPGLRDAAQGLSAELDRRASLLQGRSFAAWHAERALARLAPPRRAADDYPQQATQSAVAVEAEPLPHLVVAVDDWDELLGSPLAHVLEDVAQRGPRLGVRLAVTTSHPERGAGTAVDEAAQLRVALRTDSPVASALLIHVEDAAALADDQPGRGLARHPDGGVSAFQSARITGRIPRTATLRPTVTPLDWTSLGEPPTQRPVRELGNGPTDLALLASALQRAAESLGAPPIPKLL
ncbi:FHA domain-containing protein [Streptacidiphilus sp. MAP5-3]|uniref:FHA domain-containing protein n=1 Tax=unclassified Streptacidiphilus TaxID=2643834 RepID=UPI003511CB2A